MKTHKIIPTKIFLLFLFSLILISLSSKQTQAQNKSSKIFFKETKHDFGKVERGTVVSYDFKFINEGEGNLIIKNVHASCGCTGATIGDKKEFKNGEEGEIKVTFNTNGRSGNQSKIIYVQSNDPENPQELLSITCDINQETKTANYEEMDKQLYNKRGIK